MKRKQFLHCSLSAVIILFAGLFLPACSSLFDYYEYGAECRNCNINSRFHGFEVERFAICENDRAIVGVGGVYPFLTAPLEEIQIGWAEADETDGARADYSAVFDACYRKPGKSFFEFFVASRQECQS